MSSKEKQVREFRKDSNAVLYADMIATRLEKSEYYPVYLGFSIHPDIVRKIKYTTASILVSIIGASMSVIISFVYNSM